MFDHEIKKLIGDIAVQVAARLVRPIRAIIRQEMYVMTDAIDRLNAQTDATLADLTDLVTEIQKDVALLAATPKDDSAAIDAVTARLKTGSDAAKAFLDSLKTPASPASPAAPAPDAPAPAPEAPAPAAAPVAPAAASTNPNDDIPANQDATLGPLATRGTGQTA